MTDSDMVMLIEGLSSDSTSEINGRARSPCASGVGSMKVDDAWVPLTGRRRFADETAGMIRTGLMPDLTLDLRYPKYAVQVAEAGSFRRAAERLSISQSTVSRRVQLFERQLGFFSLQAYARGGRLTPEGERFLQQAVVGARYLRNAATEIRSARETQDRAREVWNA